MVTVPEANDETARRLVRRALARSGFRRATWPMLVVVVRFNSAECRVMTRDGFAQWLRENALEASARECVSRRVRANHALVWAEVDIPGLGHAGFCQVALA